MSIFRFWKRRTNIPDLMKTYQIFDAKTKTARDFYNNIPINETKNRLRTFKKWLDLFIKTNNYMIEIVKRFSPGIAKGLEKQLTLFAKTSGEYLSEEYWKSTDYAKITNELKLNELIKEILDRQMNEYAEIHHKEIEMAFIVVFDTLKRIDGKIPLEPEERIRRTLMKYDSKLVEIYDGAYKVIESNFPDRYRHCSSSMRKIIDDLLGNTISERWDFLLTHIESKTEAKLIESLANLVKSIDKTWNKGVHDEIKHETAILALQSTELIINYISLINTKEDARAIKK